MSGHEFSPGGRAARWLYGLATGLAIFTGLAQLPIMKRYYVADLPGLAWSADFYVTSDLHYVAATLLLLLLAWRIGLRARGGVFWFSWGPRSAWGWTILAVLALSGALKATRNAGVYLPPALLLVTDLTHLGAAMAFMFSGLGSLIKGRRVPAEGPAQGKTLSESV